MPSLLRLLQLRPSISSSYYRLQPPIFKLLNTFKTQNRIFSSTSTNAVKTNGTDTETVMVRVFEPGKTLPHQQWMIRSNNQNLYLSWCRNAYVCLGVSVAITMSEKCIAPLPFDADLHTGIVGVAHVLLVLSQINMLFGSVEFLYHLFTTKNLTEISWITAVIYCLFVFAHAYIFLDVFTGLERDDEV